MYCWIHLFIFKSTKKSSKSTIVQILSIDIVPSISIVCFFFISNCISLNSKWQRNGKCSVWFLKQAELSFEEKDKRIIFQLIKFCFRLSKQMRASSTIRSSTHRILVLIKWQQRWKMERTKIGFIIVQKDDEKKFDLEAESIVERRRYCAPCKIVISSSDRITWSLLWLGPCLVCGRV